jgi:hypothetical protein
VVEGAEVQFGAGAARLRVVVDLLDGRTVSAPIAWYPRLAHGTVAERADLRLTRHGRGIHWPQLDEDIAIDDLLAGRRSAESQPSFERWLSGRRTTPKR